MEKARDLGFEKTRLRFRGTGTGRSVRCNKKSVESNESWLMILNFGP